MFTSVVSSRLKLFLFCSIPGWPPSPAHQAQGQDQRSASQLWMLSCSSLQVKMSLRFSSSSKNDVGDGWLYWLIFFPSRKLIIKESSITSSHLDNNTGIILSSNTTVL